MAHYQLSEIAQLDIDDLYADGIVKHGLNQADKYYDGLIEQFEFLTHNRNIGKNSEEIAQNLQRFPYGRHLIFFMNTDVSILIIRVLGHEMDYKRHLTTHAF